MCAHVCMCVEPPQVGMPMFVKSRAEAIKTDVEQQEGEDEELFPSAFGQRCGWTPRCSFALDRFV